MYSIVDEDYKVLHSGLTLKEAEDLLCKEVNRGAEDLYIITECIELNDFIPPVNDITIREIS